jgi:transposase-like protein
MSKKNPQPVVVPPPDPEVDPKPTRRRFTAAYKLKILEQTDGCSEGEIGALLRREGLYSSHLSTWRRQRAEGALQALGKKRGRKAKPRDKEKEQLIKENARLRRKLEQAEKIIEIQKKLSALIQAAERDDESGEST